MVIIFNCNKKNPTINDDNVIPELPETLTDIDGNIYQTVRIDDQIWMAENLKVTHYRSGDEIPNVVDLTEWSSLSTGAYCAYNNNMNIANTYGYLYNWYTVNDNRGIAPEGWRVPTDEDWKVLEIALGMSPSAVDYAGSRGIVEGGKLKEADTTHWAIPNTGATNASGFTALPGGYLFYDRFRALGYNAYFWSSTEYNDILAWSRSISYKDSKVNRTEIPKRHGCSIRLVRGENRKYLAVSSNNLNLDKSANSEASFNIYSNTYWSVRVKADWLTITNSNGSGSDTVTVIATSANKSPSSRSAVVTVSGTKVDSIIVMVEQNGAPYETEMFTDQDGNVYQTVKIGDQWWMAENLKVTHYRNGDVIPNVTNNSLWSSQSTGAYCIKNNDENLIETYGLLYNWYALDDNRNIAPEGWHIPSDKEWKELEMFLGMSQSEADDTDWRGADEGGKLKEAGNAHWIHQNAGATNESGFTALPGGVRNPGGSFSDQGVYANFWTSTENSKSNAWYRQLKYSWSEVYRDYQNKHSGFSIRLVRNEKNVYIYVNNSNLNLNYSKNSQVSFNIVSNTDWTVSEYTDWFSVSSTSGFGSETVTVTAMSNNISTDSRTDTLIVRGASGAGLVTVLLTQSGFFYENSTMKDQEGNVYRTVKIGDQWWMAENLKVVHYRNGEEIPQVKGRSEWEKLTTGAYCVYNNNEMYSDTYGYLYNWFAVNDNRNIAPLGWHVPTDEEWKEIEMFLGMSQEEADKSGYRGKDEGGKMKESGTAHWLYSNTGATNISNFSALPGGMRLDYLITPTSNFGGLGVFALFWSSSEFNSENVWYRRLSCDYSSIDRNYSTKPSGYSVRLVQD